MVLWMWLACVTTGSRGGLDGEWVFAPRTAATHEGAPVDVEAENQAAVERIGDLKNPKIIIVPGYTSLDATEPIQLSRVARERLKEAKGKLDQGYDVLFVTGGNVHPDGTPYNEAMEMKEALLKMGLTEAEILVDPYARHSTTNLRNVGRFMRVHGIDSALIVTSEDQSFYFGFADVSTFNARAMTELGYDLGDLRAISTTTTEFKPSPDVFTLGDDMLDP